MVAAKSHAQPFIVTEFFERSSFPVKGDLKLSHPGRLARADVIDLNVEKSSVDHVAEDILSCQLGYCASLVFIAPDDGITFVVVVLSHGINEVIGIIVGGKRIQFPRVGLLAPAIIFKRVDFPAPFLPMSAMRSFSLMLKVMSLKRAAPLNSTLTLSTEIIA